MFCTNTTSPMIDSSDSVAAPWLPSDERKLPSIDTLPAATACRARPSGCCTLLPATRSAMLFASSEKSSSAVTSSTSSKSLLLLAVSVPANMIAMPPRTPGLSALLSPDEPLPPFWAMRFCWIRIPSPLRTKMPFVARIVDCPLLTIVLPEIVRRPVTVASTIPPNGSTGMLSCRF
jgi:hypothetical protein